MSGRPALSDRLTRPGAGSVNGGPRVVGIRGSRVVVAPRASQPAPVVDQPDAATEVDPDRPWDVIVWDDPVNLMSYVVWVFMRVFTFTEPIARKLMMQVHLEGKSLVASEPRERAELYLQQLHGYGLQATIQRAG